VVFVMSLFAPAAVSDNRIALTNGASADDRRVGLGPVCVEVVLRSRKWDKRIVSKWELRRAGDSCQDPEPRAEPSLLPRRVPLEKNSALAPAASCASKRNGRLMGR
jgi:hypothetical protein